MSVDYEEFRKKQLQNPKIKAAYDALEAEDAIIRAMVGAQTGMGMRLNPDFQPA